MAGPPSSRFSGPGGPLLSSIPSGKVGGSSRRRLGSRAAGAAIFVGVFLYVLPEAVELIDDHFMHVAWGRQLLYGRWPVRDMVVLGLPLQYALSAAFESAFGYRLLSEGLIVALAFASGALLTFVLARRASGSTLIGMLAAAFQVAVAPRTYGYPKIVLYAAAILALWMYVDRPSRRRLALLAAIVDSNVVRVYSRVFNIPVTDRLRRDPGFHELAQSLLDPEHPRDFNLAQLAPGPYVLEIGMQRPNMPVVRSQRRFSIAP